MLVCRGGRWSLRLNLRSTRVLHIKQPMRGRLGAVDCFRHLLLPRTRFATDTDLIERDDIMPLTLEAERHAIRLMRFQSLDDLGLCVGALHTLKCALILVRGLGRLDL
jgi:hypothetical protein